MSTLTIHSLDPAVGQRVRRKAKREKKSLNQVMKELLAESVGAGTGKSPDHRSDFAVFAGIWSEEDQREFDAATEEAWGQVIHPHPIPCPA